MGTELEHAREHSHPIKWEEASILDCARRHQELLVKEVLRIPTTKANFNRDAGIGVHDCWVSTIIN